MAINENGLKRLEELKEDVVARSQSLIELKIRVTVLEAQLEALYRIKRTEVTPILAEELKKNTEDGY